MQCRAQHRTCVLGGTNHFILGFTNLVIIFFLLQVLQYSVPLLRADRKLKLGAPLSAENSSYTLSLFLIKTPHNGSCLETWCIFHIKSLMGSCVRKVTRALQTTQSCGSQQCYIEKYITTVIGINICLSPILCPMVENYFCYLFPWYEVQSSKLTIPMPYADHRTDKTGKTYQAEGLCRFRVVTVGLSV
jgi:hypothetical protein